MSEASQSYFQAKGIRVHYGRVRGVEDLSISLKDQRSVVALIGVNGAGKSTTLRAITGLSRLSAGEIWFDGERIDHLSTSQIVGRGIVMVPEGRRIYPFMSVKDNILMGAYQRSDRAGIRHDLDRILTRFPRLKERLNQAGGTLSGGEQEMLAIGRGLMAKPRLFLLDEPSLGLAPQIVRDIARLVVEINHEEGVGVILVEQNSRMALKISDYAYVLETGRVALEGKSSDLLDDEHVKSLYLGG